MTSTPGPLPCQAPDPPTPPSVLLVDDNPLYRAALCGLLWRACDASLGIAEAATVQAALGLARLHPRIELVVLDLNLPGGNGAQAIAGMRRELPSATFIVVSETDQRLEIQAAMRAGARAFLLKSVVPDVLLSVLRRALRLQIQSPEMIVGDRVAGAAYSSAEPNRPLTARQREVLLLMSTGCTNKEIGLRLGLAEITVKQHVSRILSALGVSNRTQAVASARGMALGA